MRSSKLGQFQSPSSVSSPNSPSSTFVRRRSQPLLSMFIPSSNWLFGLKRSVRDNGMSERSLLQRSQLHNNEPKPLGWTATAESILTKVRRGRVALDQAVSQMTRHTTD